MLYYNHCYNNLIIDKKWLHTAKVTQSINHYKYSLDFHGFSFDSNITVRKPDNQADQKKINNNNRKKKNIERDSEEDHPQYQKIIFCVFRRL